MSSGRAVVRASVVIGLTIIGALLCPGIASAACTVDLASPLGGSTQVQSPTFRWTSPDCVRYRVHFSPSGTFGADRVVTSWTPMKRHQWAEDDWDAYQGGAWSSGVYWRVQSRAADGTFSFSGTTRHVLMDPDLDDDGYSQVADADCDDAAADVFPGADEDCDDGLDNDCDGRADRCGPLGEFDLAGADATLSGSGDLDEFGCTLSAAGDVDGDGFGDVLVGATLESPGPLASSGATYLFRGPLSGALDASLADAVLQGAASGDHAYVASGAGDLNADGFDDLVIGARGNSDDTGIAYVVYGPVAGAVDPSAVPDWLSGEDPDDEAGRAVVGGGDVNGDGFADLLVGSYANERACHHCGAAYLVYGPHYGGASLANADAILLGADGEYAGGSLALADVNGDGFDDVVVGARKASLGGDDAGAVYIFFGPVAGVLGLASADAILVGEQPGDNAGGSVASAGDVDADGYGDVLVGARYEDTVGSNAGAAYLVRGPVSGTSSLADAEAKFLGEVAYDYAGDAVASAGDVNGDGFSDVFVGAYGNEAAGDDGGATYLYYGPVAGTRPLSAADARIRGDVAEAAGTAVAGDGDIDADGFADLLIGAPQTEVAGAMAVGVAWVVLGGPRSDADGDGYTRDDGDCDDHVFAVNPGSQDVCNDVDDDCDGVVDDGLGVDADADGYDACTDCDDGDFTVNPGAAEVCGDGLDNDCDSAAQGCGLVGTIDLQVADARITGTYLSGQSVTSAGDVNADGHPDILIGSPWEDSETGAAHLFYGPVAGPHDLWEADATFVGDPEVENNKVGCSVAGVGDVNGDGYDDALIGQDPRQGGGAAYLLLGPLSGAYDVASADAVLLGEEASDRTGQYVGGGGDINGDGYADLLIGARYDDDGGLNAGTVYVVFGPVSGAVDLSLADARLNGESAGDLIGDVFASAGDVDADGYDDVLVGAPERSDVAIKSGAAYLVRGPMSGAISLGSADARMVGTHEGERAGLSVAGAGDVNGDGHADLIVGSDLDVGGLQDLGAAYILYGPLSGDIDLGTADATLTGENANDGAGYAVSAAGDVNGDGLGDVLVGTPGWDGDEGNMGVTYVVLGPAWGTIPLADATARLEGEYGEDYAGSALAPAGDMDGDGYDDVLVGAPLAGDGLDLVGTVYMMRGGPGF